MKIEARPTFAQIRFDQEKEAHVVLSLTAPALDDATPRASVCIIPCIDISGSMSGPKLEFAKKSAMKLVEHLRPTDYCGVVAFESGVYTVAKPEQLANGAKDRIKSAVSKLRTMGGTNFSGGLLRALELITQMDLPENVILRVIMFTDGQANEGIACKAPELIKLLEANRGRVTVSAFGYGDDADQKLLTEFSTAGKGNYAYIKEPDAALSAFGVELGGLLSTYATDLQIEVAPLNGHVITEVVSDVDAEEETTGEVNLKMPDILAEEARHIVLAVKFAEQKQAFPREVNVFDCKLSYSVIDKDGKKERKTGEAKCRVQFVKEGDEQAKADPALDKIVGLAQLVKAQIKADEAAQQGNFAAAAMFMQDCSDDFESRGLGGHVRLAGNVRRRMVSKSSYDANQGYLRSARMGGTRGMGVASYDSDAREDLAEVGLCMENSMQASTSASFTEEPSSVSVIQAPPTTGMPVVGSPILMPIGISSGGDAPAPWTNSDADVPPAPPEPEAPPARKPIKQSRSTTPKW